MYRYTMFFSTLCTCTLYFRDQNVHSVQAQQVNTYTRKLLQKQDFYFTFTLLNTRCFKIQKKQKFFHQNNKNLNLLPNTKLTEIFIDRYDWRNLIYTSMKIDKLEGNKNHYVHK